MRLKHIGIAFVIEIRHDIVWLMENIECYSHNLRSPVLSDRQISLRRLLSGLRVALSFQNSKGISLSSQNSIRNICLRLYFLREPKKPLSFTQPSVSAWCSNGTELAIYIS